VLGIKIILLLAYLDTDGIFWSVVLYRVVDVFCQELGVDESRIIVSYDQMTAMLATVSVLPQQQTMTSDSSIDTVSGCDCSVQVF